MLDELGGHGRDAEGALGGEQPIGGVGERPGPAGHGLEPPAGASRSAGIGRQDAGERGGEAATGVCVGGFGADPVLAALLRRRRARRAGTEAAASRPRCVGRRRRTAGRRAASRRRSRGRRAGGLSPTGRAGAVSAQQVEELAVGRLGDRAASRWVQARQHLRRTGWTGHVVVAVRRANPAGGRSSSPGNESTGLSDSKNPR